MNKARCKEIVYTGERWDFSGHSCQRYAVADGYCKQHNPERSRLRREHGDRVYRAQADLNSASDTHRAYILVEAHLKAFNLPLGLGVTSGALIARTAYEQAKEILAKIKEQKP